MWRATSKLIPKRLCRRPAPLPCWKTARSLATLRMRIDGLYMIYLRKANDNLVSHCKCDEAYISAPSQMDCPWCGCGWLFTCSHCRKAFTFAEAVEGDFALDQM